MAVDAIKEVESPWTIWYLIFLRKWPGIFKAPDTGRLDKESAMVKGYLPRSIKVQGMNIWIWNHLSKWLFKTFCWVSGPDFLPISVSKLICGSQVFQFTYSMMLFFTIRIDYNNGIFQYFDNLLLYFINCRFTDGLAALGVLRANHLHPKSMTEIFVSSGPATLTSIIGLKIVNYSAEGSNKRQRKEKAYAQYMDILEEIYSMYNIAKQRSRPGFKKNNIPTSMHSS